MGSRTDFELRPRSDVADEEQQLLFVFSCTSWWSKPDEVSSAGGLNRSIGFRTPETAFTWVHEQFELPPARWTLREDGTFVASKGDPFP